MPALVETDAERKARRHRDSDTIGGRHLNNACAQDFHEVCRKGGETIEVAGRVRLCDCECHGRLGPYLTREN